jgi:hypothetical protein
MVYFFLSFSYKKACAYTHVYTWSLRPSIHDETLVDRRLLWHWDLSNEDKFHYLTRYITMQMALPTLMASSNMQQRLK